MMDIFKLPLFDETIDYLEGSEEQESDEEEGTDDHEDSSLLDYFEGSEDGDSEEQATKEGS